MPKPAKRPLSKTKPDEASPYEMKVFKKPVAGEVSKKAKKSVPEPVISESSGSDSDSDIVGSKSESSSDSDTPKRKVSHTKQMSSDESSSDSDGTGSFVSDVDDSDDESRPVAASKPKPTASAAEKKILLPAKPVLKKSADVPAPE